MNDEKLAKAMAAAEAAGYKPSKSMEAIASMPLEGTLHFTGEADVKTYTINDEKSYSLVYLTQEGISVSKTYLFGKSWKRTPEAGEFGDYQCRTDEFTCPTKVVNGKLLFDIPAGSVIVFKDLAKDGKVYASVYKNGQLQAPKERKSYSGATVTIKK